MVLLRRARHFFDAADLEFYLNQTIANMTTASSGSGACSNGAGSVNACNALLAANGAIVDVSVKSPSPVYLSACLSFFLCLSVFLFLPVSVGVCLSAFLSHFLSLAERRYPPIPSATLDGLCVSSCVCYANS